MATSLICLFATFATVGLAIAGLLIRWLAARAGVLVDEMVRQDYPSVAGWLGNWVLWLAARRTADPLANFEEWLADLEQERAATGKPSLGSALWTFINAGRIASHPATEGALAVPAPATGLGVDPEATVLITDGTGILGGQVAEHLVGVHGVRHLVLTSCEGIGAPGADMLVAQLESAGAAVTVAAFDPADRAALATVLASVATAPWPLRRVIHIEDNGDDGEVPALRADRLYGALCGCRLAPP